MAQNRTATKADGSSANSPKSKDNDSKAASSGGQAKTKDDMSKSPAGFASGSKSASDKSARGGSADQRGKSR